MIQKPKEKETSAFVGNGLDFLFKLLSFISFCFILQ